MKKIIIATKKSHIFALEDAGMCSASETDDFDVASYYEYELPTDYGFFTTKPRVGDYIEVVYDEQIIGYACPIFYIVFGEVFDSFASLEADGLDYERYQIRRQEDVESEVSRQIEALECGGE